MTKATTHQASKFTKLLYLGTSGTGKTGSLLSLLEAGYNLRIMDLDNGLDELIIRTRRTNPDLLDSIDYITLRDKMKSDKRLGAKISGSERIYVNICKYLDQWDDESIPSEWGEQTIFVLDSLTYLGRAIYNWAEPLVTAASRSGKPDPRQIYSMAQDGVLKIIDLLTSKDFKANVIVISHIDFIEMGDGIIKGFPSSIGRALGPKLPAAFNNTIMAKSRGSKRQIHVLPTDNVELKTASGGVLSTPLPLESGLASLFRTLKGQT